MTERQCSFVDRDLNKCEATVQVNANLYYSSVLLRTLGWVDFNYAGYERCPDHAPTLSKDKKSRN